MKNIKYFLLPIFLSFCLSSNNIETDSTRADFGYIENEKEIKEKNLYLLLNRDLDLYTYDLSIGNVFPLKGNLRNNFKPGNSISLSINTPYKTPKLLNRYSFDISAEISLKKMINKNIQNYASPINSLSMYLILNNKIKTINLSYGIGFSELFTSDISILAPSLKLKAEYELKLFKLYSFLIKNDLLEEDINTSSFIQKLRIYIGLDPEITFGFPAINRTDEIIILSDIYFKINLFSL